MYFYWVNTSNQFDIRVRRSITQKKNHWLRERWNGQWAKPETHTGHSKQFQFTQKLEHAPCCCFNHGDAITCPIASSLLHYTIFIAFSFKFEVCRNMDLHARSRAGNGPPLSTTVAHSQSPQMVSLFSPCAAPPFVLQSAPVLWSPPGHAPVPLFPPGPPPPPPPPFLHMTDGGNGPHNATPKI